MAENVTAGDEVRVFDVNGRRMGQPEGGWPGTVVKVTPSRAYIVYAGIYGIRARETGEPFALEDGCKIDRMRHRRFKTLEQADRDQRMAAARLLLRLHGIVLDLRHALSLEQAEALAEVAAAWELED